MTNTRQFLGEEFVTITFVPPVNVYDIEKTKCRIIILPLRSPGATYTQLFGCIVCLFLLKKLTERCSGFQTQPSQNERRSRKTLFVSENSCLCSPKLVCLVSFRSHKNISTCDIKRAYEGTSVLRSESLSRKAPTQPPSARLISS